MDDITLAAVGQRVASARERRGLTQPELAAKAGVSLSQVKKIEQGSYPSLRLPGVRVLAEVLNVQTSQLLGEPDADPPDAGDAEAWEQVRLAAAGQHDAGGGEPDEAAVSSGMREATGHILAARFGDLREMLPGLLADADALAAGGGREARLLRSRARLAAAYMLGQVWQPEAALDVLRLAGDDAAGDPGGEFAVAHWTGWARLRSGDLAGCAALASDMSDRLDRPMWRMGRDEIAAWGRLQVLVATCAARDNRPGEAQDALRWARTAATAVGDDYVRPSDPWDPFGVRTVEMAAAEIAGVQRKFRQTLAIAGAMDGSGFPVPRNWHRSRLDVAAAHAAEWEAGRDDAESDAAIAELDRVRIAQPEWLARQRGARDTVAVLRKRWKRKPPERVRVLADAVRLPL